MAHVPIYENPIKLCRSKLQTLLSRVWESLRGAPAPGKQSSPGTGPGKLDRIENGEKLVGQFSRCMDSGFVDTKDKSVGQSDNLFMVKKCGVNFADI